MIASEGLRAALDYADVFTALAEADLLDRTTAADLRDTARFRNLLVHGYTKVDDLAAFRTALARAAAG